MPTSFFTVSVANFPTEPCDPEDADPASARWGDNLSGQDAALRRLAASLVRDQEIGDVVQETWVSAMEMRAEVRLPTVWLASVLRYKAARMYRSDRRRREELAEWAHRKLNEAQGDDADDREGQLSAAVEQLPERYRTPLVLRHIEGWSIDEIARHLGRQRNTVRSQLVRAVKILRRKLAPKARRRWVALPVCSLARKGQRRRGPGPVSAQLLAAAGMVLALVGAWTIRWTDSLPPEPLALVVDGAECRRLDEPGVEAGFNTERREVAPVATVRGRVVRDRQGVANATIVFRDDGSGRSRAIAMTDGAGYFVSDSAPTRGWVRATLPWGGHTRWVATQPHPGRTVEIRVQAGLGELRGRVLGAAGEPLDGALVGIHVRSRSGPRFTDGEWHLPPPPVRTTTDSLGRFSLQRLSPHRDVLLVMAHGYAPRVVPIAKPLAGDIRLQRATQLSGRVVSVGGRAVAGAKISVGLPWPAGSRTTRSGADGCFVLDDLPAGRHFLRVTMAGGAGLATTVRSPSLAPVVLRATRDQSIVGVATDPQGRGLDGWVATLLSEAELEQAGRFAPLIVEQRARTHTSADGSFVFAGCVPGTYVVTLSRPGAATPSAWRANVAPGSVPCEIVVGAEPRAGVSGRLAGIQPGDRAEIRVPSVGWSQDITIDPAQRFEVHDVPPGTCEIWVWPPASPPRRLLRRTLLAGESAELGALVPPRPGQLEIQLAAPQAELLANVSVILRGDYVRLAHTPHGTRGIRYDGNGRVTANNLVPGTYELRLRCPGFVDLYQSIEIQSGATTTLRHELERGRDVAVRVSGLRWLLPREPYTLAVVDRRGCELLAGREFYYDGVDAFSLRVCVPVSATAVVVRSATRMARGRIDEAMGQLAEVNLELEPILKGGGQGTHSRVPAAN